jgi:hypothetical protein
MFVAEDSHYAHSKFPRRQAKRGRSLPCRSRFFFSVCAHGISTWQLPQQCLCGISLWALYRYVHHQHLQGFLLHGNPLFGRLHESLGVYLGWCRALGDTGGFIQSIWLMYGGRSVTLLRPRDGVSRSGWNVVIRRWRPWTSFPSLEASSEDPSFRLLQLVR